MHDDDALDPEQVLRDRHRAQRVDRASTGDHDLEQRRGGRDLLPRVVSHDRPGKHVAELLGDRGGNSDGARVVAIDDDGSQWHRLRERPPDGALVVARLFRECVRVESFAHWVIAGLLSSGVPPTRTIGIARAAQTIELFSTPG